MGIKLTLSITELLDTLKEQAECWRPTYKMSVGEWLGELAVKIIKNKTQDKAAYTWTMKRFGPKVSYADMVALLEYMDHTEDFQAVLEYNSETKMWTVKNIVTSTSFKKAMDAECYKHKRRVFKIMVGGVWRELTCRAGNSERQTIPQWILQATKEKIKTFLNMEDLRDATVTMEPVLNLLEGGTHYRWAEAERIMRLASWADEIEFALDVQGDNIRIKDMTLPASMNTPIEMVKAEKGGKRRFSKEFTVGEMFTGLLLSKDCTAELSYMDWLGEAVQRLLNVKKEMPSDFSIRNSHGPKICWGNAMDYFATHTESGDRFRVLYSLTDEYGDEDNSAIKFYNLEKLPENII